LPKGHIRPGEPPPTAIIRPAQVQKTAGHRPHIARLWRKADSGLTSIILTQQRKETAMYTPNDDIHRQVNRDRNRYAAPVYESSAASNGGLLALLVVVALLGGLITLSMLGPSTSDGGPAPEATTPESISGGQPTTPAD